jgi:hypothetical protein
MRVPAVVALSALMLTAAQGEDLTFVATGKVSYVFGDIAPYMSCPVPVGSTLRFKYSFDPDAVPLDCRTNWCLYANAVRSVQVDVNGNRIAYAPCPTCNARINIENDNLVDELFRDAYQVVAYQGSSVGTPWVLMGLFDQSSTPSAALSSVDLPLTPPSPDDFLTDRSFFLTLANGSQVQASVQSLSLLSAASTQELLMELAQTVVAMNVHVGISNSLDAKLNNAIAALDSAKQGHGADAVTMLGAFTHEVDAQRGLKLSACQADQLTAQADEIVSVLTAP